MDSFINLLFPTKCIFCGINYGLFCSKCLEKCWIIEKDYCIVCDKFSFSGYTHKHCFTDSTPVSIFSCFSYTGITRKCLKVSKFGSKQFAALKILIDLGIAHAKACGKEYKDMLVVPIPISAERYKSRGFNQALIIAKKFANAYNLPLSSTILLRIKTTEYQFTKKRAERYKSLEGAFSIRSHQVIGKKVILIDDLTTSGATLLEAAKVLYAAGALEVHCFTLCKREKML